MSLVAIQRAYLFFLFYLIFCALGFLLMRKTWEIYHRWLLPEKKWIIIFIIIIIAIIIISSVVYDVDVK